MKSLDLNWGVFQTPMQWYHPNKQHAQLQVQLVTVVAVPLDNEKHPIHIFTQRRLVLLQDEHTVQRFGLNIQ